MTSISINIRKKKFIIESNNIKKENLVLSNLNIDIKNKEFISIFGPSGCGKTTLLNLISGLDKDFNGSIKFDNDNSNLKKNINYMFQSPRLFPWLTAIENIKFPIKNKKNCVSTANKLIKEVGLEKFKDHYPSKLSGGMQRRISLARAFSNNPNILLLDEPFISIDRKTANSLKKLLINLWKKSKPIIIFVTHDLNEAIELADRIIFLSKTPSKKVLDHKISLKRPRKQNSRQFENLKRLLSATSNQS